MISGQQLQTDPLADLQFFCSLVVLPTFHVQPHIFDLVRFLGQVFPKLQQHNLSSAEEHSTCLNIEFMKH